MVTLATILRVSTSPISANRCVISILATKAPSRRRRTSIRSSKTALSRRSSVSASLSKAFQLMQVPVRAILRGPSCETSTRWSSSTITLETIALTTQAVTPRRKPRESSERAAHSTKTTPPVMLSTAVPTFP